MPELPEVEITRRHLSEVMVDERFLKVSVTHPRTARHNQGSTDEVVTRLTDRRVVSVNRKGKFLILPLDDGQTMVSHLGMSGRFAVDARVAAPHTHFSAEMSNEALVSFIDPRTFGFVAVFDEAELLSSGLARLGPDAWENPPDVVTLAASLANRTAPIKALLLDQGPISGLGNIYADEALFLAGIDPLVPPRHDAPPADPPLPGGSRCRSSPLFTADCSLLL